MSEGDREVLEAKNDERIIEAMTESAVFGVMGEE